MTRPVCPACGTPLPSGVFGASCPKCQLEAALPDSPEVGDSPSETPRAVGANRRDALFHHEVGDTPSEPPAPAEPVVLRAAPRRLGDYDLLEEIGRGGMGVVFKARQARLNRLVALKMTLAGPLASPEAVRRLRAEAETIGRLRHENIVAVHDIGEADGRIFFSMDYVAGSNLAVLAREKPWSAREAAGCLRTVAEAIAYAHAHDVVHRDLKPSNILIDERGQPRITDFGLAKTLTRDAERTVTHQALGSPSFCAPEQAAGRRDEVGPRSDLYSLGAILYFLLTGRPPLLTETLEQTLWQVLHTEPAPPRWLNPAVPTDLETICLKCLEKDPARRYATAQELADELGRFLCGEPIRARPVSAVERGWRWCRRNPLLAGAGASLVVLVATVAVIVSIASVRLAGKERTVQRQAYAADLRSAQQALEAGNYGLTLHFLNQHKPTAGQPDLRDWEWRYFRAQARPEALFRVGRHPLVVSALTFSPDGARLASGGSEGEVKLWDLTSRREIATRQHRGSVDALAFSANGRLLASGGGDGEIRVWDGATLTETTASLGGAFSRDLNFPVGEPGRSENRRDDVEAVPGFKAPPGQEAGRSRAGRQVVTLRFAPDGERLIVVVLDRSTGWVQARVVTLDLASGQRSTDLEVRAGAQAAVSPDGALLATGGAGGQIWLWDLAAKAQLASWSAHPDSVNALAFSPDGRWLVSAGLDKAAKVWGVPRQPRASALQQGGLAGQNSWRTAPAPRETAVLVGSDGMVSTAAFSSDGRFLATGSDDQTLRVWNTETWQEVALLRGQLSGISSVAFAPTAYLLATGGKGGEIRLWNAFGNMPASPFTRLETAGQVVTVGADALVLKSSSNLCLINARTGQERRRFDLAGLDAAAFALSPDARWVAAGTLAGELLLWDATVSVQPKRISVDTIPISDLEFAPDGQRLAAVIAQRQITLLDLSTGLTGSRLTPSRAGAWELALRAGESAPQSSRATTVAEVWAQGDHKVSVDLPWTDVKIKAPSRADAPVTDLAFSPNGRRLAISSADGSASVWEAASARKTASLTGTGGGLWSVSWSPDERRLATGTGESAILIWDLASGRVVAKLKGHAHSLVRARFLRDGDTLVSYAVDELFLWQAPPFAETDQRPK